MAAIREAAVAGSFYPGRSEPLVRLIRRMLSEARISPSSVVRGLIVPHAGYRYSGPIAATAYRTLTGSSFSRVLLVGPSHFVPVRGAAVSDAAWFRTPLGRVEVDVECTARLAKRPGVVVDEKAHAREHSLETQLPFLQETVPGFKLIPVAVGDADPEHLADALEPEIVDGTLVVISSDLSHYHDHETARRLDAETAAAIESANLASVTGDRACGSVGINTALVLARRRGWSCRLLDLRTSGDTAGDHRRVVGYGAFALV